MYTEFIIIYILLGLSLVCNIITVIVVLKNKKPVTTYGKSGGYHSDNNKRGYESSVQNEISNQGSGFVFCKNCGHRYSQDMVVCPKCGTVRNS